MDNVLKSIGIDLLKECLDVSPINDMKWTQRCNMDWHKYWNRIFVMADSRGRYFPWTLMHNNINMTWTKTRWCSGYYDFLRVIQRSKKNSKDWFNAEVQRINMCAKTKCCVQGWLYELLVMFSKTAWLASFNFSPIQIDEYLFLI